MMRLIPATTTPLALGLALALAPAASAAQEASPPTASTSAPASQLESAHLRGLELRTIGPAAMSGRIVDLAVVEDDPVVFYAASATGGVWKTVNGGVTWTAVFDEGGTHSVGDIALHQRDTSVVWVGTGERANRQSNSWGDGVYKSTDGGRTWQNMGLRETKAIGRIVMHPENADIVYVAAMGHLWGPNEERGLYRSTDGGETWEKVLFVDENTGVVDVAIDPERPEILYAASYQRRRRPFGFHGGGPGSALWKSEDGGDTWRELTDGLPEGDYGRIGITIYPRDPRIVYVSVEQGFRFNASTAYVRPDEDAGIFRSENRGETWQHMGSWNPRPMYASQPMVDPNDPCRLYMQNAFSVSTDCGRTFDVINHSLHGDDRFVWIDPADSRHMIKADDGGIGITRDQGETWLYVTNLPVSQYYRIAVDDDVPYNIYGGLQDNGTWIGPSATYRSEGILNEDWVKVGGGDGFLSLPDTVSDDVFYVESQYLGLSRVSHATLQGRDIRPGDPHGAIGERRNYDQWFTGEPQPELMQAMAPANWDGPYTISPHDNDVLYAGTAHLWRSDDRGRTWTDLGDLTTGTDRRTLTIMGQSIGERVPSIDDGAPYWPTLTIIEESPLREGLLYVGTDDGLIHVSHDGGATFTEISDRLPGLPDTAWINGIEASAHDAETVYVVANDYRRDDYGNYAWRSTDAGRTWETIVGDLPPERVLRTLREDPRDPDVLWLGTELGAFVSIDAGAHWTQLDGGLPTVAVNDLRIHERDNDLVLGTHGRGIWILDNVNAIQQLSPAIVASDAHLFTIEPAVQIRRESVKGHAGDMVFRGENPPLGAIIDYWLRTARDTGDVALVIRDADGRRIADVTPSLDAGGNRVVWDMRHESLASAPGSRRGGPDGPLVVPGTYTAELTIDGVTYEQAFDVREDPRLDVPPDVRRQWTTDLLRLARLRDDALRLAIVLREATGEEGEPAAERGDEPPADDPLREQVEELLDRTGGLYRSVSSFTGPMTADQRSREAYYRRMIEELGTRVSAAGG